MRAGRSAFLVFFLAAMPLLAQEHGDRKTGFTFSIGMPDTAIAVRRIVTPKWTLLGSLMYGHNNSGTTGAVGAADITSWGVGAAVRRVFVSEELRPFVEVGGAIRRADVPGCGHVNYPYANAGGGVEYYVARRVSIEGSAGLSYSRFSETCTSDFGSARIDSHSFSTFRSALSLTFYF